MSSVKIQIHNELQTEQIGSKDTTATRISKHFKEYGEGTSIHGIKYICEEGRHVLERQFLMKSSTCKSHMYCMNVSSWLPIKFICRFLWIILVIGMIILSVLIIAPIYEKYRTSPTVTTVSETNYPVWGINFPAVTIYSNNKIIETQLNKILKDSKGA